MAKPKKKLWVGFDLGGTKMLAGLLDDSFRVLGSHRRKTKAHEGAEASLNRIVSTINEALTDAGIDSTQLAGIGVGCPGPLDLRKGVILEAPNLGWHKVPLRRILEKAFGCAAVIANDVDAGTYGEYTRGAAKGARCALGVFPGTGIGAGCVYDDKLIEGKSNSCMEIGHLTVVPDGELCGCGMHGCLETVASRLSIAAAAATAAFRGKAPYLMENTGTDIAKIRSRALAESIAHGDAAVEQIVRRAAAWIGRAVGMTANLIAPDIVVLGGGLVEAMPEIMCEEVTRAARSTTLPTYSKTLSVVPAQLGDDATVLGAAAWARKVLES